MKLVEDLEGPDIQGRLLADNATWSGVIGALLNKTADVAIGPIIPIEKGRKVVAYSMPFMFSKISALITQIYRFKLEESFFTMMMSSLTYQSWLVIATVAIILSLLLSLLDWITPNVLPFSIIRSFYFIYSKAVYGIPYVSHYFDIFKSMYP